MDLLPRLLDAPDDDALRLVYADALEEGGEPEKGEYLRLECAWRRDGGVGPRDWSMVLVRESVSRINSIKAIRELSGRGLKEAKDVSDAVMAGTPTAVTRERTRAQAEADAIWHRRVPGVVVEVQLEGRAPLESERQWERLLALSARLDGDWLRAVSRLWAVALSDHPEEEARELIAARVPREGYVAHQLTGARLEEGLTREDAAALASELNARWPRLAQLQRSQCFFDWPAGLR